MNDSIGEKIKKRRIALGLSQTELARRAGYADKSGISKIESGDRSLTPEKIALFARALDLSPGDLLPGVWERPLRDEALVLTEGEEIVIRKLRELPDRDRDYILRVLDSVYSAFMHYVADDEGGSDDASL